MRILYLVAALILAPTCAATELVVPTHLAGGGQVLVIQNHIPVPIAPQGNTIFSYQHQIPYASQQIPLVDPAEYLRAAQALAQDANATAQLGIKAFSDAGTVIIQNQSALSAVTSRGEAAERVLKAAGLSASGVSNQSTSVTLQLTQGADGQICVQVVKPNQVSHVQAKTAPPEQTPVESAATETTTALLATKCASCHSAGHKSNIVLDRSTPIDLVTFAKSADAIRANRMPPKDSTPLSAEEKGAVFAELLDTLKSDNPAIFPD